MDVDLGKYFSHWVHIKPQIVTVNDYDEIISWCSENIGIRGNDWSLTKRRGKNLIMFRNKDDAYAFLFRFDGELIKEE